MSKIKIVNTRKSKNNVFTEKEKQYRMEASRKVSLANKRLARIEQQNLTMSPAYKKWLEEGGQKFSIRGKSAEEVRIEVARLNNFIKQTTSTVRGTKKYLTNIASQVGIKQWGSFQSLNNQLRSFFEVSDRVREYLKNMKEVSVSIGYKKIWEQVNEYAESVGKEFTSLNEDIVDIANTILISNSYSKLDDLTDDFLKQFIDKEV
jgi:hypothetical protein